MNDNDSKSCGRPENVDTKVPSMPSRGRTNNMQVLEDGLDHPPSSDFVSRGELRAHFVTVETLFSQLKDNISSMLQPSQGNSQLITQPLGGSL